MPVPRPGSLPHALAVDRRHTTPAASMATHSAVLLTSFDAASPLAGAALAQVPTAEPGPGEVQVKMLLAGVNPSDMFSLMGVYPGFTSTLPAVPGFDGVGVISKLGAGVTGFSAGQRVTSTGWLGDKGAGSWQSVVTLPAERLVAVPDALSDEAAAQFYINPVTVVGLLEKAAVPAGKHLLISAAGSTLSRMLIAAARHAGVKTIGLVRRPEAVAELKASTGCDEVICTTSEKLGERVAAITGGEGAHAALDSVGGDLGAALAGAVRPGGTVWLYGLMDGVTFKGSGIDLLFRDVKYAGFWLVPWLASMSEADRKAALDKTMQLMAEGVLAPAVGKTFPLSEFAAAFQESLVVGRVGKVLIKCN